MNKFQPDYYKQASPIGLPILKILIGDDINNIDLNNECRYAIYFLENKYKWKFNILTAIKYLWRLGLKTEDITSDCNKINQYLAWELEKIDPPDYKSRVRMAKIKVESLLESLP